MYILKVYKNNELYTTHEYPSKQFADLAAKSITELGYVVKKEYST